MIEALLAAFPSAQISIIPNRLPPHRSAVANSEHRLAMMSLGLAAYPQVQISRIELDREGLSYSVRTLEDFRATYGANESIILCVGADAAARLDSWHQAQQIPQLAHICVLDREGETAIAPDIAGLMSEAASSETLTGHSHGFICRLKTPVVPVSSTDVRAMIRKGITPLPVPEPIQHYIQSHALYQDPE